MTAITPLHIIFAGTTEFAAVALQALLDSPHKIIAVYTQPDRPAGRGLKLTASPVKLLALKNNLPLYQPITLKELSEQQQLANLQADVMVVAAYGLIIPEAVLHLPRLGCVNIHPSLLPRWRGAAPIQRTIFTGDKTTGVTIMQMDAGLDTGPILLQKPYTLAANETSATLSQKLAELSAEALLETLALLAQHNIKPQAQDNELATYAAKITKEEARLDWSQSALDLSYKIRAFNPKPVAYTFWQEESLRIWHAEVQPGATKDTPGTILQITSAGIDVATGEGILRLLTLQLPGGKALNVADFYHARRDYFTVGKHFT